METRVHLCRRLEVEWAGERLESALPGIQGRLLFAYLVLHRDRLVRRDELLEVLWPGEAAPSSPEAVLSSPLSRLRKALGAGRLAGRGELSLTLPPTVLGSTGRRRSAACARRTRRSSRSAGARASTPLARRSRSPTAACCPASRPTGSTPSAPSWPTSGWSCSSSSRPAGSRLGGVELPRAEQAARAAVEAAPFRESARAALIEVLRARGNVADALRAFEDARTLLREELGAAPGPLLLRLHEELLRAEPAPPPATTLQGRLAAALSVPSWAARTPAPARRRNSGALLGARRQWCW